MMKVMEGQCEHDVKVTRFPNGYGIRVYVNGEVSQEASDVPKSEVSRCIQRMLRMEDKCGNYSNMAHRSRFRLNEKLLKIEDWQKICEEAPSTTNNQTHD